MSYPTSLGAGTPKTNDPEQRGLNAIETALGTGHAIVDTIMTHLVAINERLYPAKPQPVSVAQGAIPGSIENAINSLNSRLREAEHLAQTILHG